MNRTPATLAVAAVLCGLLLAAGCRCRPADAPAPQRTPVPPTLTIKGVPITVELALTPAARAQGLMRRTDLPADHGMLFVYPGEEILSFWMKDTTIPLSIAFMDSTGRIVDIQDMAPLDETSHRSAAPAQFALEMNRGWFAGHGIGVGDCAEDGISHGP
jgi:uncharacterized protein